MIVEEDRSHAQFFRDRVPLKKIYSRSKFAEFSPLPAAECSDGRKLTYYIFETPEEKQNFVPPPQHTYHDCFAYEDCPAVKAAIEAWEAGYENPEERETREELKAHGIRTKYRSPLRDMEDME